MSLRQLTRIIPASIVVIPLCCAPFLSLAWAGGWYLMVPPLHSAGVETRRPLRDWEIAESFDAAASCEQARAEMALIAANSAGKTRAQTTISERKQYLAAICIATDDPRLKGDAR